jgi:ectoine hydroxylase-related dioxygenase (phytanoyl-CoA dioxygenase family)
MSATAVCERNETAALPANLDELKEQLDVFGYVVVPNLIPRERAEKMTVRLMDLMRRSGESEKVRPNLHGVFNALETTEDIELFSSLIDHPVLMVLVEHMVGARFQTSCSGALWIKPGCAPMGWHADVPMPWFGANNKPVPDLCFCANSIWMLTDFTKENGATRIVPMSHLARRQPCGGKKGADGQFEFNNEVVAEGAAGSLLLFNAWAWHTNGANTTRDQHRMGLSTPFYPIWLDGGNVGWTPVKRAVYEKLPPTVKRMHKHVAEDSTLGFGHPDHQSYLPQ